MRGGYYAGISSQTVLIPTPRNEIHSTATENSHTPLHTPFVTPFLYLGECERQNAAEAKLRLNIFVCVFSVW